MSEILSPYNMLFPFFLLYSTQHSLIIGINDLLEVTFLYIYHTLLQTKPFHHEQISLVLMMTIDS